MDLKKVSQKYIPKTRHYRFFKIKVNKTENLFYYFSIVASSYDRLIITLHIIYNIIITLIFKKIHVAGIFAVFKRYFLFKTIVLSIHKVARKIKLSHLCEKYM